jgi:hypothetical protein
MDVIREFGFCDADRHPVFDCSGSG